MDLFKETEMGIGLDGIVAIGDHGSKCIGDVAAVDDGDGLLHVPGQEDEGEDDTCSKDPFVNLE